MVQCPIWVRSPLCFLLVINSSLAEGVNGQRHHPQKQRIQKIKIRLDLTVCVGVGNNLFEKTHVGIAAIYKRQ